MLTVYTHIFLYHFLLEYELFQTICYNNRRSTRKQYIYIYTMIANSVLLLFVTILDGTMPTSMIHGFQIVSPPSPSRTYAALITESTRTWQVPRFLQMTSSSELMEPTLVPTTDQDGTTSRDTLIIQKLRDELIELGKRTERGFKASRSDRERAEQLIFDLAEYNQVREPVRTYYGNNNHNATTGPPSIQGKWTLVYTNAPDITSLGVPSPFVTLGRIGQDCSNPPYISNVIEWCSPSWANQIPFLVGKNNKPNEPARILQKVVTFGSAVPASPAVVDLNVAGLQLSSGSTSTSNESNDRINDLRAAIEEDGVIVGVVKQQQKDKPNIDLLKLDESRQPPFGSFEILYLDDTFRITKTSRNHYAINVRIQTPEDEWF
jgi:PAP_fibrillin